VSWIYRYTLDGKAKMMGLGGARGLGLAKAREKAQELREDRAEDKDPRATREGRKDERRSFRDVAELVLSKKGEGWRSNTLELWRGALDRHIYPTVGDRLIQDVTTELVLRVLKPIWTSKPEMARKVRGIMEKTIQAGFTLSGVSGIQNPAVWRGHLEYLLPHHSQIHTAVHRPSLAYQQLPEFIRRLRAVETFGARALEFLILTACRPIEVCEGRWDEIEGDVWTIPGSRMKGRKDFQVPLSPQAMRVIEGCRVGEYLFLGNRAGGGLATSALLKLTKKLDPEITPHGFRSSFRTWAAEVSNVSFEIAEGCLAHTTKSPMQRAYHRSELLGARRKVINDWADYLDSKINNRISD
jgi:integrase